MKAPCTTVLLAATLFFTYCGKKSDKNEESSADSSANTAQSDILPADVWEEEASTEVLQDFEQRRWYKGSIDEKYAIWLYVESFFKDEKLDNGVLTAFYGYDTQKGAAIRLNGHKKGRKISFYEGYNKDNAAEFFEGTIADDGSINGTWSNKKGKKPFALSNMAAKPKNTQGLLQLAATLAPERALEMAYGESFKDFYAEKKYMVYIPELLTVVSQPKLKTNSPNATLIGKKKVADGWLVFFKYDNAAPIERAGYMENPEDALGVALLSAEGVLLDVLPAGNAGNMLGFSAALESEKILLEWEYYGRGPVEIEDEEGNVNYTSATVTMGTRKEAWVVRNKKFVRVAAEDDFE